MSNQYAENVIAEITSLDHHDATMPRWFGAKREASFAMLRRFHHAPPPSSIYHYTSSAALISIVANNELWLSEATYLNDRNEIELGRRLARDCVMARIATEVSPEVGAMLKLTLSLFENRTDPHVYVACFSFDGDDLTQWRAYGGAEAPVAIEFVGSPLMFGYHSEPTLDQVVYDPNDQRWIVDNLVAAYADSYREDVRDPIRFVRKGPSLEPEKESEIVAGSLYHALWNYIVTFKDPAFVSEREVRFIYTAHDFSIGNGPSNWIPEQPTPLFRSRSGRVIPYLTSRNLVFKNMDRVGPIVKLPIRSIRIGPTAEPALLQRGIRSLLDAHGHENATIAFSASPFRSG